MSRSLALTVALCALLSVASANNNGTATCFSNEQCSDEIPNYCCASADCTSEIPFTGMQCLPNSMMGRMSMGNDQFCVYSCLAEGV